MVQEDVEGWFKWLVVFSAFASQFLISGITYCVGIYYIIFKENLGGSSLLISTVSSLNTAFCFGIGPLAGVLIEKYGSRPVAILGSVLGTLGMACTAYATQPWQLLLTFGVLTGGGIGLCYMPTLTVIGEYFYRRRSIAMGMAVTGLGAGPIALTPVINYLNKTFGWRGSILLVGGLYMHTLVFALLYRPVKKETYKKKVQSQNGVNESDIDVKITKGTNEKTDRGCKMNLYHFKNIGYDIFILQNILYSFGISVINVHVVGYVSSLGFSEESAGMMVFMIGMGSAISRVIYGMLAQVSFIGPTRLYTFVVAMCSVATLTYPFGRSYTVFSVSACTIGVFYGAYGSLPPLITLQLIRQEHFPTGFGYICIADACGILLGAPVAGCLYDATNYYPYSFFLGGGIMLTSCLTMIWLWYIVHFKNPRLNRAELTIDER